MSEDKKVPKLRFSGYEDNWKKTKLDNLSENVIAGATPKTSIKKYWVDGIIPWMASGEIHKKRVYNTEKYITVEGFKNSSTKMIPINSVLIALAGQGKTRGTVAINKIKLCTNQSIASIVPNDKLNYNFLYYYLGKNYNKIRSLSNADSGKGGLNLSIIRSFSIILPEIKEQEKIGNFLFTFDEKINLLNDKLRIFCEFKRYLLQNLFPKSGELAPKLRFKNEKGENYSNWNKTSINDVIVESKTKNENNENLPVISSTLTGICLQKEYFNKKVSSKDIKNYKIVCKGYFTYRSMSDTGKFRFNIQNILDKAIVSPAYPVFKTKSCINSKFFELYLNYNPLIKKQILYIKEGGTRYALSISKLKKMNIIIPSMEEQEKIADYLTEVDNKIDLIQVQIDKMEEFKKGLLQQMFV